MQRQIVTLILAAVGCLATLTGCDDSSPASVIPNTVPNIGPAQANAARPPKLGLCAGCHGDTGKAVLPEYPNLTGQNQRYLANSLRAYQSGERKNSAMRAMVGTLTDAEIEELASYYANTVSN